MAMLWAVTTLLGNNPLSRPARAQAPAWSQQQEEQPGPYFALVIGIDEYPKLNKQSQLKTAVKDAEEIARILREDYEFEVVLLRNREANRDGIMSALNSVNRKLSKDGNLLIYYAGHGKYDSQGRKAYWLAYDADEPDDNTHWISADEITAFFWRMSARHILIVSDSCYSGGLSMREAHPGFTESDWDKYVQKMIQGSSRTLMSSGGLEPVEDDHGGDHSVFANALIRGLAQMTPDTFPARNLFNDFIQVRVGGSSEQMPQYDFIRNSAQEYGGGDFVFLRKKQAAATGDAERQRQQCDRQIISACLNLSSLYRNGTGVDKNEERAGELQEKALTLQRRACDAGSGQQCLNLGYEHEFGRLGAPVDT
ncbi:MAG TPA: caspase family protein, partial [Methylomirabilota bacterium]|nr:caspase family protein [Methylomirabilota bacterium]